VLARQVGDTYEQARAHRGLASVCRAAGDSEQARRHWRQASARYAHLGAMAELPVAEEGGRG
jgi:hypothetical protein